MIKTLVLLLLLCSATFSQVPYGPSDPAKCNPLPSSYFNNAPTFFNTTSGQLKLCLTTDTWTPVVSGGGSSSFATLTGQPGDNANLTTALNLKESILGFTSPLSRTGNTVSCPTCGSGGSGTPGGSSQQIQFNDAGAFGGSSLFTFDKASGHVGIGGPPDSSSGYWLKFTSSGAGDTQMALFAPSNIATVSYLGFSNKPVMFQRFDGINTTVVLGAYQGATNAFTISNGAGNTFAIRPNGYLNPSAANTANLAAWGEPGAVPLTITHWLSGATRAGTDVNAAGAPAFVLPGPGTGSGGGGDLHIQRVPASASGTARDAGTDALLIVSKAKALTNSTPTNVCDVPIAPGASVGVTITYTVLANDGTDYQSAQATYHFSAVNKGGTITLSSGSLIGGEETAASSGTLTSGPMITAGSGVVHFNLTPLSSLTPTTLQVYYRVSLDAQAGVVVPF